MTNKACVYSDVCPYLKYCVTLNPNTCGVDMDEMRLRRVEKKEEAK